MTAFDQHGFDARLEWGVEGARVLAGACRVLVVVDVLSFTTAVEVAVGRGAVVHPRPWPDAGAAALARRVGGVVAAGERRPDGALRPAVEDLLGAGAILEALGGRASPEARAAVAAFRRCELPGDLVDCASGRELADLGQAADVRLAAQHDVSQVVPILRAGAFTAAEPAGGPAPPPRGRGGP